MDCCCFCQCVGMQHARYTMQNCNIQLSSIDTTLRDGGATHTWCLLVMFSTCAGVKPVKLNMPICAAAQRALRGIVDRPHYSRLPEEYHQKTSRSSRDLCAAESTASQHPVALCKQSESC